MAPLRPHLQPSFPTQMEDRHGRLDSIAHAANRREAGRGLRPGTIARVGVEEGFRTRAPDRPLRVLLVIKCLGYGGAERLLVDMVAGGDVERFDYEVAYVNQDQDALVPAIVAGERVCTPSAPPTTRICGGWRPSADC